MVKACALVLSIFAAGICHAEPMVLKCNTRLDGPVIQSLIVDIDKRSMKWGDAMYKIISMTDRYITGLETLNPAGGPVGGEIWVLDRDTGEYWRASVFLGWEAAEMTPEVMAGTAPKPPEKVLSSTYHGKCNRPI